MISDNDIKQLALLGTKFMLDAKERGHSMATVESDPVKLFGLPGGHKERAGRMVIAIAGGPSIDTLNTAIKMVQNPH